jgi:CRP-like cAMP-binding protein
VHLGPREAFGEFSFADRRPASATVVATEPTEVWEIPYADLDQLLASDPAIALKVFRAMLGMVVGRLRRTDADLAFARYIQHCV